MTQNTNALYRFFKRCSVGSIIVNHYNTFYDDATEDKRCSKSEIFWQFFFFIGISLLATYFGLFFTKTALDSILTVQSILTPFLFSTLFIVADKRHGIENGTKRYRLINDTIKNIAFNILLSILIIIITVIYLVCLPETSDKTTIVSALFCNALNILMYFFILNQMYVFIMIMKRVNKMFD
ncbi:MAG: hypothetical protein ACLRFF_03720 [Alphaproteobacteria bacterium]